MDNQPANDYLTQLGLDKDPFSEQADQEFYYENTELMQRLDMIQHLIGFSSQLIFITGEDGIGKTAMLQRLQYYAPDHWRICHIQANPMLSTPILLRQLTSGFELQPSAGSDDMIQVYSEALQTHIDSLERAMQTPVVLIDDAHVLPVDALTLLFGFLQQESGQARMKIALFCEPQIMAMLESPQLKPLSQNITHQLDIPAFTEKQTADYLEQRLEYAGLSHQFPFSDETVQRIHREAGGNAARINLLAQEAMYVDDLQTDLPVVDQVFKLESVEDEELELDDELGDILVFDDEPEMVGAQQSSESDDPDHSPAEHNKTPIIRKFQSWQIGAVAVVLALLAGVLWLTSQISEISDPSIADEVPLDLSPQEEEEISNSSQDSTLFDESTGPEDESLASDQVLTELGERVGEPELENNGTPSDPSLNNGTTEDDPLGELVQNLEGEQIDQPTTANQSNQTTQQNSDGASSKLTAMIEATKGSSEANTTLDQTKKNAGTITEPEKSPVNEEKQQQTPDTASTAQTEAGSKRDPIALLQEGEETSPTIPGVKGESWLRSQDDKQIFLQLMGTHDKQALSKFLAESDMGNGIAWFTTVHNGSPWYVVVKGPYASRSAAQTGITSLPEETRQRNPWPRSVANLKQAMDQAR